MMIVLSFIFINNHSEIISQLEHEIQSKDNLRNTNKSSI
jgi:hypothetical protein